MRRAAAVLVASMLVPRAAAAHAGRALEPHDIGRAWLDFDPLVVILLWLIGALYWRGIDALWREQPGRGIRRWEARCFAAGWLTLVVALLTPIHALGEALFAAHMVQHELIMAIAAPLLVLGRPVIPLLWALPMHWRRRLGAFTATPAVRSTWRTITRPLPAFLIHGIAIWGWHVPALYQASLASGFIHALQHASFLGTALLFWWAVIHPRDLRAGYGAAVFYLFATAMHSGGLGALLTFAARPWYQAYAATTAAWGLTPLEDQQLAGLIMWIPSGLSYLTAALALLALWMKEAGRRADRWQARVAPLTVVLLATGALAACGMQGDDEAKRAAFALTGGNVDVGRQKLRDYGCGTCHTIPGVRGARATVGPPLTGIAGRMYIAGLLPNEPRNLMRWIMDPTSVDSATAMPDTGVTEDDARHIAAYLYSIR